MTAIGKTQRLQVIKQVDFGVYLDGGDLGSILLPRRYVPTGTGPGDWLEVFIYLDSEDRLVATTETPLAQVGECAPLKVVETTPIGAFLDWGLSKDLLVPFGEQAKPMQAGEYHTVYVYLDPHTHRIVGSSKLNKHLSEKALYLAPRQAVDLLIYQRTDLGYMAVIDNRCLGLLFHQDIFQPVALGQRLTGYVKEIRPDKKITLCLQLQGSEGHQALTEKILDDLKQRGGSSPLTDKSSPEDIYRHFGVSKASYKRALGTLYKQHLINIEKERITLL